MSVPLSPSIARANSTVCPAHPNATDDSNPLGTFDRPRVTLPNPIPAGTVVDLMGPYDTSQTSPRTLQINGTASAPVVIRNGSRMAPAIASQSWEVTGTHWTIDNIGFRGVLTVLAPSDTATIRDCEFQGTLTTRAGIVIASYSEAWNRRIACYRNWIHDSGDVNATFDQDFHGIGIGPRSESIYLEQNRMERCSGDGVQINGGMGGHALIFDVFVSDNTATDNRQTGFWAKQCTDVVFYQNVVSGARPGAYTSGAGMGCQYDPEHVWFVKNDIADCAIGIRIASDTDDGIVGTHRFIIGNVFRDIRSEPPANPADPYQDAAISIWSLGQTRVFENVITDCDCGIAKVHASAAVYEASTTMTNVARPRIGGPTPVNPSTNVPFIENYYAGRYGVPL